MSAALLAAINNLQSALGVVGGRKKNPAKRKAVTKRGTSMRADAKRKAVPVTKRKSAPARKKNPLNKYIVFVGPQFDSQAEAVAYAQRFATKYGTAVHVYKA